LELYWQTPVELQVPETFLVFLQTAPVAFCFPALQVVEVEVVWHLDFWKQEVLALAQTFPDGSNLQLVLQQETPLKSETILPLTNFTPGSHCSVPSTIPFPQIPALIGVWVF